MVCRAWNRSWLLGWVSGAVGRVKAAEEAAAVHATEGVFSDSRTAIVLADRLVRGRGGQPMRIPRVIKHTIGGNTVINVVDTGGDKLIQDRFRGLRDVIYNYGEKGYDVQNCTLCGGSGVAAATGGTCPKCQGVGFLNKGWG